MTITTTRQQRRALLRANRDWPEALREIPREEWPSDGGGTPGRWRIVRVWRSRDFLVQQHDEPGGVVRLSVNRTRMLPTGRWDDSISWDELQRLKAEAGYGDRFAVEVYPAERDVVNVANMRHLWLLPTPPAFAWRRP